ncbi:Alpha-amylase [Fulvia fulva]|uniref:alpha-amylase n=1 Tax=Passalora fulva TaxID=5499 RepID=A0A9Q8PDA9_PASFU|nr:Alpha-amylase [Fulvia fulva]KAK4619452.1 Alpha-amylase [Fulvia fulva]KAK4620571.1 Alpha-amylase [Fulvia fulva]UJO20302.1 Alpha-amylase [Fulvia fulva]WPV17593.1 Alpha-amylase [Fulvia fulva]WPV32504.1 Alpha-amylase [Fulvia fulva]
MPDNATLLQGFEWNVPADGKHWKRLLHALPVLKECGIDNIWLPPGCKASSPEGNGYDVYDLYDLGEFDQKGGVGTKWGTKDDLIALSQKAQELGVGLYWDAVLNHKAGADKKEKADAVEVDENDRNTEVSDSYQINAWLGFDFPGRGDKYKNKGWSETVDDEQGNADFMMFADVDYSHPEVEEDVKNWGTWIVKEVGLQGFRLDAVQHFSERFTNDWVEHVRKKTVKEVFMLDKMNHRFSLFDAPPLYNFSRLSTTEDADLRTVFDNTLVKAEPVNAVTVVMNHDTQPGQTMDPKVEGFFKLLAYALILLQDAGYPCLFYGDLYGISGDNPEPPSCGNKLPDMVLARKLYAYGQQDEYLDQPTCIGFVRRGNEEHHAGLAWVMSNAGPGEIRMAVGEMHAGQVWTDVLGWQQEGVEIDEEGYGLFKCPGTSVSIWVRKDAKGRDRFPVQFDHEIYKSC